jgi:hypothetical protein
MSAHEFKLAPTTYWQKMSAVLLRLWVGSLLLLSVLPAEATANLTFAPSGDSVASKIDFARLESDSRYAVARSALEKLTTNDLVALSQEQLDQLYARLSAGPYPLGRFSETVLKVDGGLLTRISKMSKGGVLIRKFPLASALKIFWSGKFFSNPGEDRVVQNQLSYNALEKMEMNKLLSYVGAQLPANDSIFKTQSLRFPAKVYCGSSLLDSRRESIILDYAYAEDLKNQYLPQIDFLTGRHGLMIRDELRMVNSHLYLGRAYFNRFFVFNFVLSQGPERQNATLAGAPLSEPCWAGTQARAPR